MSFEIIDTPTDVINRKSLYAALIEAIDALPPGKSIQVSKSSFTKSFRSNFRTAAMSLKALRVSISSRGDYWVTSKRATK